MKELAKKWAAAGHAVFPLKGKRPLVKWKDDANCHTDYNAEDWAVRCDKLTVIDHDSGKSDYNSGWLPPCKGHTQKTNNGTHEIFAYDPNVKRTSNPCGSTGIDIKTGNGSYIKIYGEPPVELVQLPPVVKELLDTKTATVQKLLRSISSDCPRERWLPCVTAIKGLLQGTHSRGLEVAWAWSKHADGLRFNGSEGRQEFVERYRGLALWAPNDCLRVLGGVEGAGTWELETYANVTTGDAEWILEEFLPKGEITTLTGEPGVGKTRAALYIAIMNALGKDMPCFKGVQAKTKGRVLFWGPENDDRTVIAPIIHYMGAGDVVSRIKGEGFNMGNQACKDQLYSWMRSKMFDIVIIDPLYDFARSVEDANSLVDITECMEQLNSVAQETGVSVIGIMHTPKGAKARDLSDRTHGSQGWAAKPRMRLLMQQTNGTLRHDTVANPSDISLILKQKNSKGLLSDGLAFVVEPKRDPNQPHLTKSIGIARCVTHIEGRPSDLEKKYLQPAEQNEDEYANWDDLKEMILEHADRKDIEVDGRHLKGMFAVLDADIVVRYAKEKYNWKKYRLKTDGCYHKIHSLRLDHGVYYGVRLEDG